MEEPKDNGRRIFIVVIFVFFIAAIAFTSKTIDINQYANAKQPDSSQAVNSNATSSQAKVNLSDIPNIRTSAKEQAIKWVMDNMEMYGKASDGRFSEQTGLHSYTLRYDYRVPNVFGANEKHVLYLIYTESNSEWQLYAATADGQSLEIVE